MWYTGNISRIRFLIIPVVSKTQVGDNYKTAHSGIKVVRNCERFERTIPSSLSAAISEIDAGADHVLFSFSTSSTA